jgi:hypothetical protein
MLKGILSMKILLSHHWSNDGTFVRCIANDCIWVLLIGGQYVLLVRLNLETGEQTELPDKMGLAHRSQFLKTTAFCYLH